MNKHGRFYSFNSRTTSFLPTRVRKSLVCELQLRRKRISLFTQIKSQSVSETLVANQSAIRRDLHVNSQNLGKISIRKY